MPLITKHRSDGTSVTYTQKEYSDLVGRGLLFVLGALVLVGILIKNLFSFATLADFGPSLYLRNITHFHTDEVIELDRRAYLFPARTTIAAAERGQGAMAALGMGQRLHFEGQVPGSGSTWLAVRAYSGSKPLAGWIWLPCDSDGRGTGPAGTDPCWRKSIDWELQEERGKLIARRMHDDLSRAAVPLTRVEAGLDYDRYKESAAAATHQEVDARLLGWNASWHVFVDKTHLAAFNAIRDRAEQAAEHAMFGVGSLPAPLQDPPVVRATAPTFRPPTAATTSLRTAPAPVPAPESESSSQASTPASSAMVAVSAGSDPSVADDPHDPHGGAIAPSFDCGQARLHAELLICANPDLAQADLEVSQLFRAVLAKVSSADEAAGIRAFQREWLNGRRNTCGDVECLRVAHQNRLALLASQLRDQ